MSSESWTRRGFVRGAATAGATLSAPVLLGVGPALAGGKPATGIEACTPLPASAEPTAVALRPDGKLLWVTNSAATTITAIRTSDLRRGRSVDVGGTPIDIAIAPGGRIGLVLTAFYDRPGLAFVDLARGRVVKRLDVGDEPHAVAVAPDGARAYVSGGGEKGTLTPVDLRTRSVRRAIAIGVHPRGVSVARTGELALVALGGAAGVALVDLHRGRVRKVIETAAYPYRLATSPDGSRGLVTHSGYREHALTLLDLKSARVKRRIAVGKDPCAVGFTHGGSGAIVSDYGASAVTLVELVGGRRLTVRVGHRPRGLAITRGGDRAYVVNEFEGTVSAIRLSRTRAASGRRGA